MVSKWLTTCLFWLGTEPCCFSVSTFAYIKTPRHSTATRQRVPGFISDSEKVSGVSGVRCERPWSFSSCPSTAWRPLTSPQQMLRAKRVAAWRAPTAGVVHPRCLFSPVSTLLDDSPRWWRRWRVWVHVQSFLNRATCTEWRTHSGSSKAGPGELMWLHMSVCLCTVCYSPTFCLPFPVYLHCAGQ